MTDAPDTKPPARVPDNIESRIEERLDKAAAGAMAISADMGGLAFSNMGEVMEFSKLMAMAGQAVPPHLRGKPGMCLGVCIQALGWQMDPFSVANKSYAVNDRLAYEAQLIHAVIERRAPIKGRLRHRFEGEAGKRVCIVWGFPEGEDEPLELASPEFDRIQPKNSPLWKSKPDQQQFYNTVRDWCRRYFPDVILGVYAKDEIEDAGRMRDVTPATTSRLQQLRDQGRAAAQPEIIEPEDIPQEPEVATEEPKPNPKSEAFNEGRKDYEDWGPAGGGNCPYDDGTQEACDFWAGWRAAREADPAGGEA